jgi:hypothetical protein
MLITTVLLFTFTSVLGMAVLLLAGWGVAQWASGREFTGIWESGDVVTALRDEVLQRSGDIHAAITRELAAR